MKKIIVAIVAMLAVVMTAGAQNDMYNVGKENSAEKAEDEVAALKRQEQKSLQQKIDSVQFTEATEAIRDTAFTLEADNVVFKYGERAYVTPLTNFVSVSDGKAVIQTSFNIPVAGPNGMGGITVDGNISKYKMSVEKNGNVSVSFYVMGTLANCQVNISLYGGSNKATVELFPTFNSDRLTLEGAILPNSKSFVVQGRTL